MNGITAFNIFEIKYTAVPANNDCFFKVYTDLVKIATTSF